VPGRAGAKERPGVSWDWHLIEPMFDRTWFW